MRSDYGIWRYEMRGDDVFMDGWTIILRRQASERVDSDSFDDSEIPLYFLYIVACYGRI